MSQYFVDIRHVREHYNCFLSAKDPIDALVVVKRDWYDFVDRAERIEITEVCNYEVPEATV